MYISEAFGRATACGFSTGAVGAGGGSDPGLKTWNKFPLEGEGGDRAKN